MGTPLLPPHPPGLADSDFKLDFKGNGGKVPTLHLLDELDDFLSRPLGHSTLKLGP